MEQFDARAVMAARIKEECHPDGSAGRDGQPPPLTPAAETAHGDGPEAPPPAEAARSRSW
jgi:hypothetical protein